MDNFVILHKSPFYPIALTNEIGVTLLDLMSINIRLILLHSTNYSHLLSFNKPMGTLVPLKSHYQPTLFRPRIHIENLQLLWYQLYRHSSAGGTEVVAITIVGATNNVKSETFGFQFTTTIVDKSASWQLSFQCLTPQQSWHHDDAPFQCWLRVAQLDAIYRTRSTFGYGNGLLLDGTMPCI